MKTKKDFVDLSVVIKGAGEMASGVAHRLYRAGIRRIVMLEMPKPLSVRRSVSFCEAVYDGLAKVEGVEGEMTTDAASIRKAWEKGRIAVIVDPEWKKIGELSPDVVVDATMAKRNLGTTKNEAPFVVGVGPGFEAPRDVHVVVESNRGHDLGRVIYDGGAEPYTGVPGEMKGVGIERVLRAPAAGVVRHIHHIGDAVKKGEAVLFVDDAQVCAPFDGILRGLIREIRVDANEKVGDVDPRAKKEFCHTISDKARGIGGGVLEALLHEYSEAGK